MSYLHCHSCDWSQDDFWTFRFKLSWKSYRKSFWKLGIDLGYNPFTKFFNDLKWLFKPRWMGLDGWIIDDITKYTGVNVRTRTITKIVNQTNMQLKMTNYPDVYEVKERQVFSWSWLCLEVVKEWKNYKQMRWWTWKQWNKEKDTAICPGCGERNFDID